MENLLFERKPHMGENCCLCFPIECGVKFLGFLVILGAIAGGANAVYDPNYFKLFWPELSITVLMALTFLYSFVSGSEESRKHTLFVWVSPSSLPAPSSTDGTSSVADMPNSLALTTSSRRETTESPSSSRPPASTLAALSPMTSASLRAEAGSTPTGSGDSSSTATSPASLEDGARTTRASPSTEPDRTSCSTSDSGTNSKCVRF